MTGPRHRPPAHPPCATSQRNLILSAVLGPILRHRASSRTASCMPQQARQPPSQHARWHMSTLPAGAYHWLQKAIGRHTTSGTGALLACWPISHPRGAWSPRGRPQSPTRKGGSPPLLALRAPPAPHLEGQASPSLALRAPPEPHLEGQAPTIAGPQSPTWKGRSSTRRMASRCCTSIDSAWASPTPEICRTR